MTLATVQKVNSGKVEEHYAHSLSINLDLVKITFSVELRCAACCGSGQPSPSSWSTGGCPLVLHEGAGEGPRRIIFDVGNISEHEKAAGAKSEGLTIGPCCDYNGSKPVLGVYPRLCLLGRGVKPERSPSGDLARLSRRLATAKPSTFHLAQPQQPSTNRIVGNLKSTSCTACRATLKIEKRIFR